MTQALYAHMNNKTNKQKKMGKNITKAQSMKFWFLKKHCVCGAQDQIQGLEHTRQALYQ
jgi:hypothetical protein